MGPTNGLKIRASTFVVNPHDRRHTRQAESAASNPKNDSWRARLENAQVGIA